MHEDKTKQNVYKNANGITWERNALKLNWMGKLCPLRKRFEIYYDQIGALEFPVYRRPPATFFWFWLFYFVCGRQAHFSIRLISISIHLWNIPSDKGLTKILYSGERKFSGETAQDEAKLLYWGHLSLFALQHSVSSILQVVYGLLYLYTPDMYMKSRRSRCTSALYVF